MSELKYKIEMWPPRERGGQHVGTGPHGIQVTHLETGLVAFCDVHRSPFKNREVALSMIEWGLLQLNS